MFLLFTENYYFLIYMILLFLGPTILQKGERPKTEDFLTFLCLRGTEYLPPELGFFNQVGFNIY